ncbi:hypothetical protein AVEN_186322-1, partial [Araneus ventricosus]
KWYFISQNFKSSPTTIHPEYFNPHKDRLRDPFQSKVHLLYSLKNTALSASRHVGDSVNATPEAGHGLRDQVRSCPFPDLLAPVVQYCVR